MVLTATAEKARVVNSGVIAEASRLLDLGLQAAHSFRTRLTPVSKVSPGQTGPLQHRAVGAAEAHVVRSRVVPGGHGCLHAKRESHQEAAAGTPQRLTPRAPPAREAETRGLRGRPLPTSSRTQASGLPSQVQQSPDLHRGAELGVSHPLPRSKPPHSSGGTCLSVRDVRNGEQGAYPDPRGSSAPAPHLPDWDSTTCVLSSAFPRAQCSRIPFRAVSSPGMPWGGSTWAAEDESEDCHPLLGVPTET